MSAPGQNRKSSMRAYVFRCSPNNGHRQDTSACPFRAISGHSGTPAIRYAAANLSISFGRNGTLSLIWEMRRVGSIRSESSHSCWASLTRPAIAWPIMIRCAPHRPGAGRRWDQPGRRERAAVQVAYLLAAPRHREHVRTLCIGANDAQGRSLTITDGG
jgi:hypothetical protein